MATNTKSPFMSWLGQNAWPITISILGILGMGLVGLAKIEANAQEIRELKEVVAEYPSRDWFSLKFQNIDARFDNLEEKIEK